MRSTHVNIVTAIAILSTGLLASCGENVSPLALKNSPPRIPHLPEPADNADYVREYLTISWECSDHDGDEVTYYIQVKENDSYVAYAGQTLLKTLDTGFGLSRNMMYTWRVIATDGIENSESDWWTFFTPDYSNEPPDPPAEPHPADGSIDVQINGVYLTWSAVDPDLGDILSYDVYFGTGVDPGLVATGLTETSYALPSLDYDTVFFWRIVSTDSHDESTSGPVWTFTTRTQPGGLLAQLTRLLGSLAG